MRRRNVRDSNVDWPMDLRQSVNARDVVGTNWFDVVARRISFVRSTLVLRPFPTTIHSRSTDDKVVRVDRPAMRREEGSADEERERERAGRTNFEL